MTNQQLQNQFNLCQQWNDPEQWNLLALAYYQRGYLLNALHCFEQADLCKVPA